MKDIFPIVLMLVVFAASAAMVVRAFRTGVVSLGSSLEANRRDAGPTFWFLVALWSISAAASLAIAVTQLLPLASHP